MKILGKNDTGQIDDHTTRCFLDYTYFRDYYKIIVIDLIKQQAINFGPKAIQKISFTANLDRAGNTIIYFILEAGSVKVLQNGML